MIALKDQGPTPSPPTHLLEKYSVLKMLWTHRAQKNGFTIADLAHRLDRSKESVREELNSLNGALRAAGLADFYIQTTRQDDTWGYPTNFYSLGSMWWK